MKKLALLSALLTTFLLSTSPVIADQSAAASGLRTRTEPALACLLGFAPWGCQNLLFEAGRTRGAALWNATYCTNEYLHRRFDYCPDGPLEAVDYLGTNATGADVYAVQYMHANTAYVIAPPGPDGKIGQFWIKQGNPSGIIHSSLIDVRSSDAHKMTLYRRPWQ